jgi:hypothetical protein
LLLAVDAVVSTLPGAVTVVLRLEAGEEVHKRIKADHGDGQQARPHQVLEDSRSEGVHQDANALALQHLADKAVVKLVVHTGHREVSDEGSKCRHELRRRIPAWKTSQHTERRVVVVRQDALVHVRQP